VTEAPRPRGDADGPLIGNREAFLDSARAGSVLTRELDRLIDRIVERMAVIDDDPLLPDSEIRRTPGRLIVQLGPVALTVSWIRGADNSIASGRLMVVEWLGTVARGATRVPERIAATNAGHTARVQAEDILAPEATSEADWTWCREAARTERSHSVDLAERCVSSLHAALIRATATPPSAAS
jgi:hypothetical protein